jgi:hypothetical protein
VAHEYDFSDVAVPRQHFCLTLPLRDFSIGHRIIFMRQRNVLVFGDESEFLNLPFEEQTRLLIDSVSVCNRTFKDRMQLEKFPTKELIKQLATDSDKWKKEREEAKAKFKTASGLEDAAAIFAWWQAETDYFRKYLNASRIVTDFKLKSEAFPFLPCSAMPGSKGRSYGAPYEAQLIQFLIRSRLCQNADEAMEYPFALAEMHYLTHLEHEGSLQIMNHDELAHKERMLKLDLDAARKAGFGTVEEHIAFITGNARAAMEKQTAKAETSGLASEIPDELKGTS